MFSQISNDSPIHLVYLIPLMQQDKWEVLSDGNLSHTRTLIFLPTFLQFRGPIRVAPI
jgi:hypothetical protein